MAGQLHISRLIARLLFVVVLSFFLRPGLAFAQTDPLPSWNESTAKQNIINFVGRVTESGGADFVPEAQRVAVFDNDGTLWAEQPIYFQVAYAMTEIREMSGAHPEWKDKQPFKAVLDGDHKALAAAGEHGLLEIMAVTHSGMTTESYNKSVVEWLHSAKHPRFDRLYTDLVYQPMLELLRYLRVNEFKTFIVSGGGVEFMRCFADKSYGIPPEQIVGSSGVVKFEIKPDGKAELIKEPKIEFIDDGPGKPVGINRFIGRQPIFAFGNSDGDQQMLEDTASGDGARFMGLVHHTDAEREWAYDRKSQIGKLDKALDEAQARGWTVVDMKTDWKTIFPEPK
jgi:phosphoglycolate phosphatase-like HAD superfamily hydrolase